MAYKIRGCTIPIKVRGKTFKIETACILKEKDDNYLVEYICPYSGNMQMAMMHKSMVEINEEKQ